MILVSACLWGQPTRYDGRHSLCRALKEKLRGQPVLALCPEVLGGLTTPRPPVSFVGASRGREGQQVLDGRARLLAPDGGDCTAAFISGARQALELALAHRVTLAYLKDRSPSCAYDPLGLNPKGGPGLGVLTALLLAHNITVREIKCATPDS